MHPTHLGIAELVGDHRPQILALAARRGASDVRVFGTDTALLRWLQRELDRREHDAP